MRLLLPHPTNTDQTQWKTLFILFDQKVNSNLAVKLGPKAQPSTSLGFELGIFKSGVKVLTHFMYSNFAK